MVSVNIGQPMAKTWTAGTTGSTGIDKRPIDGRARATAVGFFGDAVLNTRHHGGVDQALYAYAREDARWWSRELGRELPPGRFGENLSTDGVDVTGAVIGERWSIGEAVVEVSAPRIPCANFAGFWQMPDLVRRFTARGTPGAYLRVIEEGEIGAGDGIALIHRPGHGVTVGEAFRALLTAPDLLPRLLDAPELPAKFRDRALRGSRRVW